MYKVLVDKQLKTLGSRISFLSKAGDFYSNIQPSSLDIGTSNKIYHLTEDSKVEYSLSESFILKKGERYLIPSLNISLPNRIYAVASPKSSIGRVDLHVRLLTDNSTIYNYIPSNYEGTVWLELVSNSFDVKIADFTPLIQLLFFDKSQPVSSNSNISIIEASDSSEFEFLESNVDLLTLHLDIENVCGYKALDTSKVLDLSSRLNPALDFFEPLRIHSSKFLLQKDKFYIMRSKQKVCIPPEISSEMVPYSELFGELRSHYAGYFDPGFGYGVNGNYAVLEIRPYEDIIVSDNKPICLMKSYINSMLPEKDYGQLNNNYTVQDSIRLAKFFSF
jgi:dCTP deaminase